MTTKDRVSPQVLAVINAAEQRSEILISFIQVGFVVFMGALYFIAPKGYMGDVPVRPVPLVLLAYTPFVVVRLILALRRRLVPVILNISVILDVAMICVLLWTFHIQYEQDTGLYLKAPTAMYLFIFVALRALRFDPRYVVFAGVAAAVGWAGLTIIAIMGDSGVTRDFVDYMTSTKVLIGAQVDRIIALLAITAILAVSVKRAGDVLTASANEQQARRELSRYFAPEVASRIVDSHEGFQPGDGEVHTAVTLMVDLRGFSRWADGRDPSEVMKTVSQYQSRVVRAVLENGGSIDKFMGDGVLCHFGAVSESETCARDALNAAEHLCSILDQWRDEMQQQGGQSFGYGIGIAGGRLTFGAVGEKDRLEFTVIGSPVNTCAKLEKHTKQLGARILVPVKTYGMAVRQGFTPTLVFKRARGRRVEGLSDPMDLAVVLGDPDRQ